MHCKRVHKLHIYPAFAGNRGGIWINSNIVCFLVKTSKEQRKQRVFSV